MYPQLINGCFQGADFILLVLALLLATGDSRQNAFQLAFKHPVPLVGQGQLFRRLMQQSLDIEGCLLCGQVFLSLALQHDLLQAARIKKGFGGFLANFIPLVAAGGNEGIRFIQLLLRFGQGQGGLSGRTVGDRLV